MTQFRKGDIVTVECIVKSSHPDLEMRVRPVKGHSDFFISTDQVKLVRHDVKIDDTVRHTGKSPKLAGRILSIHDIYAWVDTANGFDTWELFYCRRISDTDAQVAA